MTDFFDKLKKGMDIKNIQQEQKFEPEPPPEADPPLAENFENYLKIEN